MQDNKPIQLTKIEAARRQIDTAIQLYFTDGDSVSALALTFAASDVLRNIADAGKQKTIYGDFIDHLKPALRQEFLDLLRKPQVFIKHADQNPADIISFYPRAYEIPLLIDCELYAELTENPTILMEMYSLWRFSENPQLIASPDSYRNMLEDVNRLLAKNELSKNKYYKWGFLENKMANIQYLKYGAIGRNKSRKTDS